MEFIIDIPDSILRDAIVRATTQVVTQMINEQAHKEVYNRYKNPIQNAVELYLEKKISQDDIKKLIDKTVAEKVKYLTNED